MKGCSEQIRDKGRETGDADSLSLWGFAAAAEDDLTVINL